MPMAQGRRLRVQFGLGHLPLGGDHGLSKHKAMGELRALESLSCVRPLKSAQIRSVVQGGAQQLALLD